MLRAIAVTNAIVLLDLAQHKIEADVRTVLIQGGRTRVHCILMIAAATILAPTARRLHGGICQVSPAVAPIGGQVGRITPAAPREQPGGSARRALIGECPLRMAVLLLHGQADPVRSRPRSITQCQKTWCTTRRKWTPHASLL
jgi:hypothetical protein